MYLFISVDFFILIKKKIRPNLKKNTKNLSRKLFGEHRTCKLKHCQNIKQQNEKLQTFTKVDCQVWEIRMYSFKMISLSLSVQKNKQVHFFIF